MKMLSVLLFLFVTSVWSQDPSKYLESADAKIYSLKIKGVKDFVVDIESEKMKKNLNNQMIFGKIENLVFRTYWTANPERIEIEVIGLPDGFKEVREELKLIVMSIIDNLLPISIAQRFSGYKISQGKAPKEFIAQDLTGIAVVPSYTLIFDDQDLLTQVTGQKPIGSLEIKSGYGKESFTDGKWLLKSQTTTAIENGQTMIVSKNLSYTLSQGIGVLAGLRITTEQKGPSSGAKSLNSEEDFEFKNYEINTGRAMKYFIGESSKKSP